MGFIPTKTSVQARGPEGPQGDIPGATSRSAGVMTAEQVMMLETVYQWHQTVANGGGVIEIIRPAPPAPPVIGSAQLEAIRNGFGDISQRVANIERAVAIQQPVEMLAPPDLSDRVENAERMISANGQQITALAAAFDGLAALIEEAQQRLSFIESHAVAGVEVKTEDRAA